ncbi:uncharacterized protein [Clytia hemisphaerica]|uniref:Cnidarian restricted protein n=1 Tax=Clytia hemisphaerica TaxID=252671 RepID=A0A7M5WIX0_9CNID
MSFNGWIFLFTLMASYRFSEEVPHFRLHTKNSTTNQNPSSQSHVNSTSNQNSRFWSRANSSANEMMFYKPGDVIQQGHNETSPLCGNGRASCNLYIRRMIYFYKVLGGWLLLGVIVLGLLSLWASVLYGRYLERKYLLSNPNHKWAFSKELIYKVKGRTKGVRLHHSSHHRHRYNEEDTSPFMFHPRSKSMP